MPYKCVHCSKVYEDGAKEVLEGCQCKSKFFFYIKPEKLKEIQSQNSTISETDLTPEEKEQIEKDVRDIAGVPEETPVFFDFESVKVIKPGKYLLDLQRLFAKDLPRVYKLEDGKYIVDLSPFQKSSALKMG